MVLLPLPPECQDYRQIPSCLAYASLRMEPGLCACWANILPPPNELTHYLPPTNLSLAPGPQDSSQLPLSKTRHASSNQKLISLATWQKEHDQDRTAGLESRLHSGIPEPTLAHLYNGNYQSVRGFLWVLVSGTFDSQLQPLGRVPRLPTAYLHSGKCAHAFLSHPCSSIRCINPQGLRTLTLLAPPSSSKSEHSDILSAHWLRIITTPHETQGLHLQDVFLTIRISLTAENNPWRLSRHTTSSSLYR